MSFLLGLLKTECILLLNLFLINVLVVANVCEDDIRHLLHDGHASNVENSYEAVTDGVVSCAQLCIRWKQCESFDFYRDTGNCRLMSRIGAPSKTNENVVHSRITDWPTQTDGSCSDRPCGDDETCVPGILSGGDTCSFSCFKHTRSCSYPPWGVTSGFSRTVGSVFPGNCVHGYRGKSAICLPTGEWNVTLKNICKPILGDVCNSDCTDINGECHNGVCACNPNNVYKSDVHQCVERCPGSWIEYEDNCYFIDRKRMTFNDSHLFCEKKHSSIIYIESKEEHEFIKARLRNDYSDMADIWVGLYQFGEEDGDEEWMTIDGRRPTGNYSAWLYPDPNSPDEHCSVMVPNHSYGFYDVHCTGPFTKVCKRPIGIKN